MRDFGFETNFSVQGTKMQLLKDTDRLSEIRLSDYNKKCNVSVYFPVVATRGPNGH